MFESRFPGSRHVKALGLSTAHDRAIWDYARANGLAIISKDGDFQQLSFLHGAPPKVIWLKAGNCSVASLQQFIHRHSAAMIAFDADSEAAVLILE